MTYSQDGKRFASGSADKCVIIWTNKLEGILKYSYVFAQNVGLLREIFIFVDCTCSLCNTVLGCDIVRRYIFRHNDAIQCLAYNPVSHQLSSCSCSDFGKLIMSHELC